MELLGGNPFITTTGAATKLGVAFTTAQRAIERLERAGILNRVGKAKRGRVYCARALLDILEEPAQLRPVARRSLHQVMKGVARRHGIHAVSWA